MSTKKTAAKVSTKTEPAAKKATAPPAPKKTVVKKTAKETATPAPVPDDLAEQIAAERANEAEEKALREELLKKQKAESNAIQKLKEENKALHREKVGWKERAEKAEETVKNWVGNVGDRVGNTAEDVSRFGEKVNKQTSRKWVGVGLAILFFIAIVFAVVYKVQRDNVRNGWANDHKANRDTIYQLRNTIKNKDDEIRFDTSHQKNNGIKTPDVSAIQKKTSVGSIRLIV